MTRPHQGGIRNHLNNLSKGWKTAGHTVHIYTPFGNYDSFPDKQKLVAQVEFLTQKYPILTFIFYVMAKHLLTIRILWALLVHSFDVINVRDVGAFNACFLPCKLFRVPIVLNLHGCLTNDLFSKGMIKKKGRIYQYFLNEEKKSYRNCKYLVAVGPQERNNVFHIFPERKKNIPIIYNLVDTKQFHRNIEEGQKITKKLGLKKNSFKVLYVGRLSRRKGIDILIKTFSRFVKNTKAESNLITIGVGPELDTLRRIASEKEISELVVFTGLVKHKELNGYYNAADVVVIPSISYRGYTEGTPTVALESMASERPLISTTLGGLRDIIINKKNGLTINENSVESLLDALTNLYLDSKLRENLSISARKYILSSRSVEKVSARWIEIFKAAIKGNKLTSNCGI